MLSNQHIQPLLLSAFLSDCNLYVYVWIVMSMLICSHLFDYVCMCCWAFIFLSLSLYIFPVCVSVLTFNMGKHTYTSLGKYAFVQLCLRFFVFVYLLSCLHTSVALLFVFARLNRNRRMRTSACV